MVPSEHARSLRDMVTRCFSAGRFDEGLGLLKEGEASLPEAIRLECLGNLQFYRRQFQNAIDMYEAAIAVWPDYYIARYHYLVGVRQEKEGDVVAAFEHFQTAIGTEPTFVDTYVELGALCVKIGDLEGALTCYRDAARLEPDEPGNLQNLVTVLQRLKSVDPVRYAAELASVEAALKLLLKSGKRLAPTRPVQMGD